MFQSEKNYLGSSRLQGRFKRWILIHLLGYYSVPSSLFLQLCLGNQDSTLRIFAVLGRTPSVLIVFGGTFSTLFIRYTIKDTFGVFGIVKHTFFFSIPNAPEVIKEFSKWFKLLVKMVYLL